MLRTKRLRMAALVTTAITATAGFALLAHADSARPLCEVPPGLAPEAQLRLLVKDYMVAYDTYLKSRSLEAGGVASECKSFAADALFEIKDLQAYESTLERLDRLKQLSPAALFDLAYALQARWESKYLFTYVEDRLSQQQRRQIPALFALNVASIVAAGGAGMNPWAEFSFVDTFRTLAVGFGAGYAAGAQVRGQRPVASIPVPPALKLSVAFEGQEQALAAVQERMAADQGAAHALGAMSANAVFHEGSRLIVQSGLPGKAKAVAWLALLGAAAAADMGIVDGAGNVLQRARAGKFRKELLSRIRDLNQAPAGSLARLEGAKKVAEAAFRVHAFRDNQLMHLEIQRENDLRAAVGSLEQQEAINQNFAKESAKLIKNDGQALDPAGVRILVRRELIRLGLDPNDSQGLKEAAGSFEGDFRKAAEREIQNYGSIEARQKEESRSLAAQVARGELVDTTEGMFFQLSAYFAETGDRYLRVYSKNVLDPLAVRYLLLRAQAKGDR